MSEIERATQRVSERGTRKKERGGEKRGGWRTVEIKEWEGDRQGGYDTETERDTQKRTGGGGEERGIKLWLTF